jgi:hypothetical protein
MKRIVLLLAIAVASTTVYSQSMLDKAAATATAAGFDVKKISSSVMNILTPKLGLSAAQIPKVTGAVNTFLQAKSAILPLLKSNKAEYQTKQSGLLNNLTTSLGTSLAKDQVNKFLGLKPATNDPTNVLSNLFY